MKRDVFNTKGDFITSVEISQMFGEVIWKIINQNFFIYLYYYIFNLKKKKKIDYRNLGNKFTFINKGNKYGPSKRKNH